MDRQYKAEVEVLVFADVNLDENEQPILDKFKTKPFVACGFDYYRYKGVLYPAWLTHSQKFAIYLNRPHYFERT